MLLRNWYRLFALDLTRTGSTFNFGCVDVTGKTVGFYGQYNSSSSYCYSTASGFICNAGFVPAMNRNGYVLGDGDTAPTLDDYTLSGNVISSVEQVSVTRSATVDENGVSSTAILVVRNTGDEEVTIREIGVVAGPLYSSSSSIYYMLLERSVLATPVTIDPGMSASITYSVHLPYASA